MKTPLNGKVGPNRRYDVMVSDLDEVKEIKNLLGGTVNDVVLATVAGGVRKYLIEADGLDPGGADFRVMAPVSVRAPGQEGTLGNHVAMWLASMPIHEPDPIGRFDAVHAETEKLKQTDQALGAATLVRLSAGAPTTLVALASRLAAGARPFNMTVTNVPGPQFPVYLLGAEMTDQYPLVPLWEGHGVGIALFSYNGRIDWGFNADYDIMENLDGFVAAIEASFEELLTAARLRAKEEAKPAKKAKKVTTKTAAGNGGPKKRPPLGAKTKPMPPLGTKGAQ
jgi:WS/DGAT/MGAT family acyltransferase